MTFEERINKIFKVNYFDDSFDSDGEYYDMAMEILNDYGIQRINEWFNEYLKSNCDTLDKMYNAINLYYCYTYDEEPMEHSLEFVAYIMYRFGDSFYLEKYDFLDGFLLGVLEKNGVIDIVSNPYYSLSNDITLCELIERIKSNIC